MGYAKLNPNHINYLNKIGMKQTLQRFFTALKFYTRIPCPSWVKYSEEALNQSTKYFPLIGWIVGGSAALVFWLSSFIFSQPIAILFSMITSILMTGAFHEDGFADVCDGFGGGWTKPQILHIMKDSRLGTYGTIGLILILSLKFFTLAALPIELVPVALIAGHSISRGIAMTFIVTHDYVRDTENSKIKPVAQPLSIQDMLIASGFALIPLLWLPSFYYWLVIIPLWLVKLYLGYFFTNRIGGYTGDCLGATQQITEVVFYLIIGIHFGYLFNQTFAG
jgi:adenosylcobinamide-GDP ribazoletransferase